MSGMEYVFADTSIARHAGVFGWTYNRANYKFDQGLRWARYTTGRKYAIAQVGMFRQDIADLSGVAVNKLKTYGPLMGLIQTVCITVLVEGRSGLKFPGPPVFVSGIYLQCLSIGFGFATLSTWLVFHSAMRAQVMATQLRTRRIRLPIPTQRQLDSARKYLSTWEEQNPYDMFRLPFVMPNGADTPEGSEDEVNPSEKAYHKGYASDTTGKKKSKTKSKAKGDGSVTASETIKDSIRMPGTTKGNPTWIDKEYAAAQAMPKSSPSSHGMDGPTEPFEHFELIRETQKQYWCAEAYNRVCFLFAMLHLVQAFSYWITLHNIAELGMVWCSMLGAAGLTAGVWLMFRMDVLPDKGGCFPIELGGPFVAHIALSLQYAHSHNSTTIDISRAIAVLILIMHIAQTFRLYAVAKPTGVQPSHQAREAGGRLFNETAACEVPSWLPGAMQICTYLVAPPKSKQQLEEEKKDRDGSVVKDDPMTNVDMTPWYYTRAMLIIVLTGWCILLAGRIVELVMGERMLVTNPGAPPWTRVGQWYGWESGPITSKHYAHITPQRGHFAWVKGWGPQGQQELWASDMFGFHPEADMHWAEDEGPYPLVGAAGHGENTWNSGTLAYGQDVPPANDGKVVKHSFQLDDGGHRRLQEQPASSVARPLVPAAVRWPALLEPAHLACGDGPGHVAALGASGLGAVVPAGAATGREAGAAEALALDGLSEFGPAKGATWGRAGLLLVTASGILASCPTAGPSGGRLPCSPLSVPSLPLGSAAAAAVVEGGERSPLRAALASAQGKVALVELATGEDGLQNWQLAAELYLPSPYGMGGEEVVSITSSCGHLLVSTSDGAAYQWKMDGEGRPLSPPRHEAPSAGPHRSWRSACSLPGGKIARLATQWRRSAAAWHPELLL